MGAVALGVLSALGLCALLLLTFCLGLSIGLQLGRTRSFSLRAALEDSLPVMPHRGGSEDQGAGDDEVYLDPFSPDSWNPEKRRELEQLLEDRSL